MEGDNEITNFEFPKPSCCLSVSEDSEDDKYYNSIQRPAFLVEGEPNFDSGPPEDGLEYLRRVRYVFTCQCYYLHLANDLCNSFAFLSPHVLF